MDGYLCEMDTISVKACAIIVAGGVGSRALPSDATSTLPKQFQTIADKPVLAWSLEAFQNDTRFVEIIVVCADAMRESVQAMVGNTNVTIARGGQTRTESVRSGLQAIKDSSIELVFIHDAARPGLDQNMLDALFSKLAEGNQGAVPMRAVADALWHCQDEMVSSPQDRTGLFRVQTPQAFALPSLLHAYDRLSLESSLADDVAVARSAGLTIAGVEGSERLDKITWPEDFDRMARILSPSLLPRVGSGFDAHRFEAGSFVTLCGVEVPHDAKLAGHSDADVGWHALADAIYGALGAGDIGHHFPPSNQKWKGAPSSVFLKHASDMVNASGGTVQHVDITLICEAPKIGPHRDAMIEATARVLGLRNDQVSIKATTTEAMGFTGRREGIAAQATATILLPETYRGPTQVETI